MSSFKLSKLELVNYQAIIARTARSRTHEISRGDNSRSTVEYGGGNESIYQHASNLIYRALQELWLIVQHVGSVCRINTVRDLS